MVAKITIPKSLQATLNYNEQKVQKGKALCLHAANYLRDVKEMNFYQKLERFEINNRLNKLASTKTLHVSLNFDPSEKFSDSKLLAIASSYMERIGFGEQPFLVYKHEDAGHPHIHIVSTTIQNDGKRINTHNIGRNQSEKARKEIEQVFALVKAEQQTKALTQGLKAVDIEKAIYGKSETKRSILNIVTAVYHQYKYCSLPEFNAALKQFNVIADRGSEEGRIFKNKGLVYRILDEAGNKAGVPIKASSIAFKPTLDNLEKKFVTNSESKESLKDRIKTAINDCVNFTPENINSLIKLLEQKHIYTVLRQNAEGRLYGITFVDNQNKVVFNGSDLGKGYSATALQSRLAGATATSNTSSENKDDRSRIAWSVNSRQKELDTPKEIAGKEQGNLEILMTVKEQYENVPKNLLQKKRKKKKKNKNL